MRSVRNYILFRENRFLNVYFEKWAELVRIFPGSNSTSNYDEGPLIKQITHRGNCIIVATALCCHHTYTRKARPFVVALIVSLTSEQNNVPHPPTLLDSVDWINGMERPVLAGRTWGAGVRGRGRGAGAGLVERVIWAYSQQCEIFSTGAPEQIYWQNRETA